MENIHTVTLPRTEIEAMERELDRLRAVEASKTLYIGVGGVEGSLAHTGLRWGGREYFYRQMFAKTYEVRTTLEFGEKWKEIESNVIQTVDSITAKNLSSLESIKAHTKEMHEYGNTLHKLMVDVGVKIKAFNTHVSKSWWLRKWYFDGKE